MVNWTIQLGEKLAGLHNLLREEILSSEIINMDETTIQVLKEKGKKPESKSFIWVMCGGGPNAPGVYFEYDPTRSSQVAKRLLEDYEGIVQTDGYAGYDFIEATLEISHAGCWAHARRHFMNVVKVTNKQQEKKTKISYSEIALSYIRQLYFIEKKMKLDQCTLEQIQWRRENITRPLLDGLFHILTRITDKVPPKSLLGKAINYVMTRQKELTLFLDHPQLHSIQKGTRKIC